MRFRRTANGGGEHAAMRAWSDRWGHCHVERNAALGTFRGAIPDCSGSTSGRAAMTAVVMTLLGVGVVAASWLNLVLARGPLSLPMIAIASGFALAGTAGLDQFAFTHREYVHQIVTFVLIVAVMGAGLAIDRRFGVRDWGSTWRLLGVVMPVSVAAIAAAAHWLLGFPWGVSVLLGGIIAPTDPVLARAVQVGPPGTGEEGELRFALTSEAGLNDGLAFPFVLLGLGLIGADEGGSWAGVAERWAVWDLAANTVASVLVGFIVAWLVIVVNRLLPRRLRLPATRDGFVAVGLGLLVYGLCEFIDVYGLVAVFAAAVTLRNMGGVLEFEQMLHDTVDRAERLVMVLVLVAFGAAVAGGLLDPLTWLDGLLVVLILAVIRPAACLVAFVGAELPVRQRLGIGLLGIRGLGSFFYMAYALVHGLPGDWGSRLWAVVGLAVLVSAVVHGAGAGVVIGRLADADQSDDAEE